jgi:hypothetical protein
MEKDLEEMNKIRYSTDGQGRIYADDRVIAADDPDHSDESVSSAINELVSRANHAPRLLSSLHDLAAWTADEVPGGRGVWQYVNACAAVASAKGQPYGDIGTVTENPSPTKDDLVTIPARMLWQVALMMLISFVVGAGGVAVLVWDRIHP